MANRYFTQFFYSFFKKPVVIAGKLPLNSSAAVGTVAIKGITSIAKTGTGLYTVTFDDQYVALSSLSACVVDSSQDIVVDFTSVNLSAKTLVIVTKVAGTAANVTDACDIYLNFLFNDSSV